MGGRTMKYFVLVLALFSVVLASALPAAEDPAWEAFKAKYKKSYESADDETARHSLFRVAQTRVAELNKLNGHGGAAFGINWMSDRYPHETFKKGLLQKPKGWKPTAGVMKYDAAAARKPASINWRFTEA